MSEDEQLIEKIHNGSEEAMETLVRRHYQNVFAFVYRRTGEYHLAYDLTQEIFLKMIKSLHFYHERGKFRSWLIKIAVNKCRD